MDIDEAIKLKNINRELERVKEEKWENHRKTDEREKVIDEFQENVRKLNQDELEKVRKMYDEMAKDGIKLTIKEIPIILKCNEKLNKKKNCSYESMTCEVEKRGCSGCYYEKEPNKKEIELIER